ncbi:MAG: DEAD/DEAH box helicase [Candidatus Cohnella colombiensis]|uniref:DEAD/DEAH box helicase n=1 Tax=Candidatus Cohnella colombiensis TaxID=3121368 RepID=A0AA95ETT6_9BACL|nr:MAG: DEAD/DEAH box helicase [Cohnella sp.]
MQAEWSHQVHEETKGNILILAPLAVASQTVREGQAVGIDINLCDQQSDVRHGINIANYEKLHKFDPDKFKGIVLDESSIIKSYSGMMRNQIIDSFRNTPYKLACTATPAPNDYMELGNHAEFLGVMSRSEMLSMFFVHDGGETQKWRLKGHAEDKFWEWVASWAVMLQKPSDLGYEDGGYILPPLNVHDHVVQTSTTADGYLFAVEALTLQERQRARRDSIEQRVAKAAELANSTDKPFLVWCDLNRESELLTRAINGAIEVKGSDTPEHKAKAMMDFADGKIRALVTKPSIAGFGMNWQHCSDMAFVGLTDSFEQIYQAVRRCYRFGQKNEVNAHMIVSDMEGAVAANVKRKEAEFEAMYQAMVQHTKAITSKNIKSTAAEKTEYDAMKRMIIPSWVRSEVS